MSAFSSHINSIMKIFISAAALIVLVAVLWLHSFLNKEKNLVMFMPAGKSQEIYILGTIHGYHFNKMFCYSIADIKSVIDVIKPDLLLIEARQESIDKYETIDGPIEMVYIWSYAKEVGIEVKGVDWYELSEKRRGNKTDNLRDDNIFKNIISSIKNEKKVLVICGARHRVEQAKRFKASGYTQVMLNNKNAYFKKIFSLSFIYPKSMEAELKKQIEFWETLAVEEAKKGTSEESKGRKYWLKQLENLAVNTKKYKDKVIIPNKLYLNDR